jgi:hypothetical protein
VPGSPGRPDSNELEARLFADLPGSKVRCSLLSNALAFQLGGAVWFPNRYQFANLWVRCGPLDAPTIAEAYSAKSIRSMLAGAAPKRRPTANI